MRDAISGQIEKADAMADNSIRMTKIDEFLREAAALINAELERLIPPDSGEHERLREAMRWSLFAGGKRFRPALVIGAGRIFGAADEALLPTAAAVEMIHTYSLIHDDLPSMDNDDLRRGRETCHKKFGEATAILAGDALQALAFQTIADHKELDAAVRMELLCELGRAAASMVAGQQLDLESEGRDISAEALATIHSNKTGALIRYSAWAGAVAAGAGKDDLDRVAAYGEKLGLLFQIVDDLLDVTQTTDSLGKTAGKDASVKKATYPSIFGIEWTREIAEETRQAALLSIENIDRDTSLLVDMTTYLTNRRN